LYVIRNDGGIIIKTTSIAKVTIYLPAALLHEFQLVCNQELRTRSEVIRSALRLYFDQHNSTLTLTEMEEQGVREEREDFHHGSSVSAGKLVHDLSYGGNLSGANMLLTAAANRASTVKLRQEEDKRQISEQIERSDAS
jgi:Arc/MetJ-type ribon-helix-helix transcriptional regulator